MIFRGLSSRVRFLFCLFFASTFFLVMNQSASANVALEFSDLTGGNDAKIIDYFSPVHFMGGGNDFVGGFFGIGTKDNLTVLEINSVQITCRRQIVGFYFNSQRGNRLWPLDQASLAQLNDVNPSYLSLTLDGGLYTNCEGPGVPNVYARYGMLTFTQGGGTTHLIAGTKINISANEYIPAFANSLENFDNKTLVGFLYDTVGGRGFLGGKLSDACYTDLANDINAGGTGGAINSLFDGSGSSITYKNSPGCALNQEAKDSALGQILGTISIDGNVALARSIDTQDRKSIAGNNGQRTIVQNTTTSLANVLGGVRKKSEELCRGKWKTSVSLSPSLTDTVICLDPGAYNPLDPTRLLILGVDTANYDQRTFIVKNADVVIVGSMPSKVSANIFIDQGNLLFSSGSSNSLQYFDENGYLLAGPDGSVTKGFAIKGNFIINGLILGFDGTAIGSFPHKVYIHGKVAALNTPVDPTPERVAQVERIPASAPHVSMINYADAFTRSCNVSSGKGSDTVPCGSKADKHTYSPIIVIDQLYKTLRY